MTKVYVDNQFKQFSNWSIYYNYFCNYKINSSNVRQLGRDASLNVKHLSHIHTTTDKNRESEWLLSSKYNSQYNRTNKKQDPNNDYWIIYSKDTIGDYLLLYMVGPDAHDYDKWTPLYKSLKTEIVEPWINGQITYQEEP